MRSQHERAVLTAAVLTVLTAQYRLASWTWSRKVPAEQAVIEAEVANGWHLRYNALPSTLAEAERSAFALVPDATYLTPDVPPDEWYHDWHGVVAGGAAWGAGGDVRSPWAVWTTRALLSAEECAAMSKTRWHTGASASLALRGLRSAPDDVSGCPYSFTQPRTIRRLGRAGRPYLSAFFFDKVRRVGRASGGAAARDRRLRVCRRQLGPLAHPHGRAAAQRDTHGHGRGLRRPHEDEAGRPGVPCWSL